MPEVLDLISDTNETVRHLGLYSDPFVALCCQCALSSRALGDFKQAEAFIERGLRRAAHRDDSIGIGIMEFYYGHHFFSKGDGAQSVRHFQNCLNMLEKVDEYFLKGLGWACQGRGYYLIGDSAKAVELIEKGFKQLSETTVIVMQPGHNNMLSEIYLEAGDLDKALVYAEKSFEISAKAEDKEDKGKSAITLGRVLGKKEPSRSKEAEEHIISGVKILEEGQYKTDYAIGYLKLGDLYTDAGQFEKAQQYINKAQALFQEMEMTYWTGRTHALLSRYHQKQNNPPQAREHLQEAIEIMKEMEASGWAERYEKELAELQISV